MRPSEQRRGVRGLDKAHTRGCKNVGGDFVKCDCAWRGRHKGHRVILAKWADKEVKPRDKEAAEIVLRRMQKAIDDHEFDPAGERPAPGTGQRLSDLIPDWTEQVAENPDKPLADGGLADSLNVISTSKLGAMTLAALATAPTTIKEWLDTTGTKRHWKPRTWNAYHQKLFALCKFAVAKKRMSVNPLLSIDTKPTDDIPALFQDVRLDDGIEAKLLVACDALNRPKFKPTRSPLTMVQADEIRARVKAGEKQTAVALRFQIKPSTVNGIVKGYTWNPAKYPLSQRGTEMRRRVIAAFDTGMRAGEMLHVQLSHVMWKRPEPLTDEQGKPFNGYEIRLPPELTKGRRYATIFVGTARLSRELEARRFALKNDPDAYLFGTEKGKRVKGIKRQWNEIFTRAGLKWGRDEGLVWHSLRAEYISRIAETTKDPVLAQQLARHQSIKTTQGYFRTGLDRKWKAVSGLKGGHS